MIKLVERTGVRVETVVSGTIDVNTANGRMMVQIMAPSTRVRLSGVITGDTVAGLTIAPVFD